MIEVMFQYQQEKYCCIKHDRLKMAFIKQSVVGNTSFEDTNNTRLRIGE